MKLTWYGGRVYDVVHQNIIFEAQLKDNGALDLPSGTLRVLCVETNDIHIHLLEGVGFIVDPLPNNLGWLVTVATMLNEPSMRTCWTLKTFISISFAIWNRWTGGLWFEELGLDG